MSKKLLEDMVPGKRSKKVLVRPSSSKAIITPQKREQEKVETKIPLPKKKEAKVSSNENIINNKFIKPRSTLSDGICEIEVEDRKFLERRPSSQSHVSKKGSKYALWVVALISIVFLFFAFSSLFDKAIITINPKVQNFELNENLTATKDSTGPSNLSFDMVSLSGEETKTVQTGDEQDVHDKAKGTVVIYNNFSTAVQKFAINTRLEGTNGKIYKTTKEIVVPGMIKKDISKNITEDRPGSVEVDIFANEAGAEYNSSPMDFKIYSFKGSTKYNKFYARSKDSIEGGLLGKFHVISDTTKSATVTELSDSLKEKLLKKVSGQIPDGWILYNDASVFRLDDTVINPTSTDVQVPITIKGTLYGFLFKENDLSKKIADIVVSKYDGRQIYIPNIKDFKITLSPIPVLQSLNDLNNIDFNLSGSSKIVWQVDKTELVNVLMGKDKVDFNKTMALYPNIESADLVIRPFWRNNIPIKVSDISITVNNQ